MALISPAQGLWLVGLSITFMVVMLFLTQEKKPKVVTFEKVISLGKRLDTGKPFSFLFGLGTHLLIAGMTNYGKSNEINYVISQLVGFPDVQFILCTAKGGNDFMQWIPRASCIALGPDATDEAVDHALEILYERYADLVPEADLSTVEGMKLAMSGERKITPSPELPLIVLVVDEFIEYLKGKNVSVRRAEKLHTVITTGRAVGIVVILATQRPSQYSAPTDLRENIPYHVAFRMDKYGTEMVFGKGTMNDVGLNELSIPGHGYGVVPMCLEPTPFIAPECNEEYCARLAWQSARLRDTMELPHLIRDKVKG